MSQLSVVSEKGLEELAGYLKRFPVGDDDAEQFWYQLACVLRKKYKKRFNYTTNLLVTIGQSESGAALTFLRDLRKRGIDLQELVDCLKVIKCQPALNFFIQGATKPVVSQPVEEQHRRLKVGETLHLSVNASCSPGSLNYLWFQDNRPLVGANSAHLTITDVTTGHTGTYHCKVTNPYLNDPPKVASAVSLPVTVEVWGGTEYVQTNGIHRQETTHQSPPPLILKHPSDVRVRVGQAAVLTCQAKEGVLYDWFKDGKIHTKGKHLGRLELPSVTTAHAGEYHCVVVNDGGSETSNRAKVILASDIEIIEWSPLNWTCSVHVEEEVCLMCTARCASGNRLDYEWFRMDRNAPVEVLGKDMALQVVASSKNLRSDGVLRLKCRVTDSKDCKNFVDSKIFRVQVQTVWIVDQPCDVQAEIKQRAQLTCTGRGEGELSYMWFKSSSQNGRFDFHKKTDLGVLPFDRLSMEDAGYYQCQVTNEAGQVDSRVVQVKPRLAHALRDEGRPCPSIKVLRQPRSCVVQEGKSFRLVFEVVCSTDDTLSYQWFFLAEKIIGADSSIYMRENTQVEDCGSYWCEVRAGPDPAASTCMVVSKPARVDLKWEETIHFNNTPWDQREGEQIFQTKSEERFAREKIALLIGNQAYEKEGLTKLNTPENDIKAVQDILRHSPFDFKVFSLVDLTHAEMLATLDMFYSMLSVSGTYALFYFSGHGFSTTRGNNFLVPVDSPPDSDSCFQVDSIIRKMQDKYSRAILFLDACKVVKEMVQSSEDTPYASIGNQANMFEEWSCVDSTSALDSHDTLATSEFNSAFINAIRKKQPLSAVHSDILSEMIRLSSQRPQHTGAMADGHLTLQDPIMVDQAELEGLLDKNMLEYDAAHDVPEPVVLKGGQMKELHMFAELKLSFSLLLTNVLSVQVELHQVHVEKTTSASVKFDQQFLTTQGVDSSQRMNQIDGQDEGLCVRASLQVRGLQKLKSPLKLLMEVCLWESGQERCANITYTFKERPPIAIKCS